MSFFSHSSMTRQKYSACWLSSSRQQHDSITTASRQLHHQNQMGREKIQEHFFSQTKLRDTFESGSPCNVQKGNEYWMKFTKTVEAPTAIDFSNKRNANNWLKGTSDEGYCSKAFSIIDQYFKPSLDGGHLFEIHASMIFEKMSKNKIEATKNWRQQRKELLDNNKFSSITHPGEHQKKKQSYNRELQKQHRISIVLCWVIFTRERVKRKMRIQLPTVTQRKVTNRVRMWTRSLMNSTMRRPFQRLSLSSNKTQHYSRQMDARDIWMRLKQTKFSSLNKELSQLVEEVKVMESFQFEAKEVVQAL